MKRFMCKQIRSRLHLLANKMKEVSEQGKGSVDCAAGCDEASSAFCEYELGVLLQKLDFAAQLASMSNENYNDTIMKKGTNDNPSENAFLLQRELDNLQKRSEMGNAMVQKLVNSIHHLHSTCVLLESQSEVYYKENEMLLKKVAISSERIEKLEASLSRLTSVNDTIRQKLNKKRVEKQKLVQNVKEYFHDYRKREISQDQDCLASQLLAHERVMIAGNRSRNNSYDTSVDPRSRTTSLDSTFSDFDVTAMYQREDLYDNFSRASSVSSVVIDDDAMPLKLESFQAKGEVILHYPANPKIGLQFIKMPLFSVEGVLTDTNEVKQDETVFRMGLTSIHNKVDSFLGRAAKLKAYFVCGFYGNDESLDLALPEIGSYLYAINGKDVDDGVSFIEVQNIIRENPCALTFRHYPLTPKQTLMLQRASESAKNMFSTGKFDTMDNAILEIRQFQDDCSDTNNIHRVKLLLGKVAQSTKLNFSSGSRSECNPDDGSGIDRESNETNSNSDIKNALSLSEKPIQDTMTITTFLPSENSSSNKLRQQMLKVGTKLKSIF
jgi:hypothetical protein